MKNKLLKTIGMFILLLLVYLIFSGRITIYSLVSGTIVSLITSIVIADIIIKNAQKIFNIKRLIYLIKYLLHYFLIIETKSHLKLIYLIVFPSKINPSIIRIPFNVKTEYSMVAIANSITNTPGTVVIDVDDNAKTFFVHWISTKVSEPEKARNEISAIFENYFQKVFD